MTIERIDRTGQTHGAIHVLALSVHNGRQWWVRWECCGRGELLDSMVISYAVKKPPACCKVCAKSGEHIVLERTQKPRATPKPKRDTPPKPNPIPKADRVRACTEAARAQETREPQEGIRIPGRGWWPVLRGPMGPRHGTGYGG